MTKLIHAELTYYLRGIGFRVFNELRGGHAEKDYEAACVWVMERDGTPFQRQPLYSINYKGKQVGEYRPDLLVGPDKVLVDLKYTEKMHWAMRVTSCRLGMIANFYPSRLDVRFLRTE